MTTCRSRYGDGRHHLHFGPLIFESEDHSCEWEVNVFGICILELQRVPEVFFEADGCGSLEAFREIEPRTRLEDPVAVIMFERKQDAD